MAMKRAGLGFASLVLIGASILFMFFVVLSGVKNTTPLNKTYFLRADTSGIAGSGRSVSQWTYFYVCGEGNQQCGSPVPALPLGYAWQGGSDGVPPALVGNRGKGTTSSKFYFMWRFGWVFYLMGLSTAVMAFFCALLAPFSRLASYLSSTILLGGLAIFGIAAALMTAEFVEARNRFRSAGINAEIGKYAFGWTWAAWFAMFLATILLCLAGKSGEARRHARRNSMAQETAGTKKGGMMGFYRNQRHKRERGSFIESDGQRRSVKDEYA